MITIQATTSSLLQVWKNGSGEIVLYTIEDYKDTMLYLPPDQVKQLIAVMASLISE